MILYGFLYVPMKLTDQFQPKLLLCNSKGSFFYLTLCSFSLMAYSGQAKVKKTMLN